MAGSYNQLWLTFAGDETEAKKCMVLGHALKETLTTRALGVILSTEGVSRETGSLLQSVFHQCHWVDFNQYGGLKFRSISKLYAHDIKGYDKIVFIDCNCFPLKNCDDFFHQDGIQWVTDGKTGNEVAAVIIKPKTLSNQSKNLVIKAVVQRENYGNKEALHTETNSIGQLQHKLFCTPVELKGQHGFPLLGKNLKMVCFVGGHPLDDSNDLPKILPGILEQELSALVRNRFEEIFRFLKVPRVDEYVVNSSHELRNSIAVVGMACIYPGANNLEEFWSLLADGKDGIVKVPEWRWGKDQTMLPTDKAMKSEAGFLPCPITGFDAKFFNTNAGDAEILDPQQRLSLKVVWEALEHAGIDPNSLKSSLTGVFGGWWRNDYRDMLNMSGTIDSNFLRNYMGNSLGSLTARISHFFELNGPAISTESGCSTSVAGLDMACESLKNETSNLAIAVGANLLIHPFVIGEGSLEGVLALDGRSKTFDESADGFGRAEGIGVAILKRFSNAVEDGDRIWGVIRGSAVVQEGTSKSMGTPTIDVEAKAMQIALERAGVDPDDVDFVETHGTGTPVGDPIEVAAIAKAYSCGDRGGRSNVLTIGSVKTNIGHTESTCGISSLHKVLLAMKNELIPKHLHLNNLNPEVDLNSIPARVPYEHAIAWPRREEGKPRIAGINSFGITGAQAHMIIQEPPAPLPLHKLPIYDSRTKKILTFSAKTEVALKAQINSYSNSLKTTGSIDLADVEYTMHLGRPHFHMRQVVVGENVQEILSNMDSITSRKIQTAQPSKLCFMFTGQGSQYPGMAKDLYSENVVFRTHFDWCDSILAKEHGITQLKEALWHDDYPHLLKASLYSQVSIFCIEFCLLKLWESWGLIPEAVVGHSLGEFAACVAAKMMTPEDALKLVVSRSKLINELPTSSMVVVSTSVKKVSELLSAAFSNTKHSLDIAAINSADQTVLAGITEPVETFKLFCDNNNIKTHILDASHAYHSVCMDPMLEEYEKFADTLKYTPVTTSCRFISGVYGKEVTHLDSKYWVRHTREMVRFVEASHTALAAGFSTYLEIGPHPVLSAFIMLNSDEAEDPVTVIQSMHRKHNDWEMMLSSLGKLYSLGYSINWDDFHRYSQAKKIDLPGYHFEETSYWITMKDDGSLPFHPLLGSYFPNASDCTIFRNSISVSQVSFLKDHLLGNKIIFPCAGYIDMCLTAGFAATQCQEGKYKKPTSPIAIRDFAIITPICLHETAPTDFQVVVTKNDSGEACSTIYTRLYLDDGSSKWVRNAKATFCNAAPAQHSNVIDFDELKSRCNQEVKDEVYYETLRECGYNLGPSLQVVTKAWENSNASDCEFLFKFGSNESAEDLNRFIIHPWLTDPMLQMQFMGLASKHGYGKSLIVPVQMDNFVWWGHSSGSGYVYTNHTTETNVAHLFDDNGHLIASMYGTEYVETTLHNIMALIDSQKNTFPAMAEIIWKEKLGPEMRRIPEAALTSLNITKELVLTSSQSAQDMGANHYQSLQELCGLHMLKAMKELGLDSHLKFTYPKISTELGIVPGLQKFFRYILLELVDDEKIEYLEDNYFRIPKPFPNLSIIENDIAKLSEICAGIEVGNGIDNGFKHLTPIWKQLSQILCGKMSASSILYPAEKHQQSNKGPADSYMTESVLASKLQQLRDMQGNILQQLSIAGKKSIIRVLEVSAGTGQETARFIQNISRAGVSRFEYTFTDISEAPLKICQELFKDTGLANKSVILNLEEDPVEQGLIPEYYDVIIASSALRRGSKDLSRSLLNLRKLLRPGGYLLLTDMVKPCRDIFLSFGGMPSFWEFMEDSQDFTLSVSKWKQTLQSTGFGDGINDIAVYNGAYALFVAQPKCSFGTTTSSFDKEVGSWVVFVPDAKVILPTQEYIQKVRNAKMGVHLVPLNEFAAKDSKEMEQKVFDILNQFLQQKDRNITGIIILFGLDSSLTVQQISEPTLYICKYLSGFQGSLKLVAYTSGNMCTSSSDYCQAAPVASPIIGMVSVLSNENPDIQCKIVDIDHGQDSNIHRDIVGEAFAELATWDDDTMVAYRQSYRCVPKLRPYKVKSSPLQLPNCAKYKLILPQSHLISDLQFGPHETPPVGEGEVEVQIKAFGLNFLDVLMVTKPDPVFEKFNYVGIDMAGVITAVGVGSKSKIGDRVTLCRSRGAAMPSHIVHPDDEIIPMPDDMTFAEASTFPLPAATVLICLNQRAKLAQSDTILIHAASGGVGCIAIQYAKSICCRNIIVTAGSERKRNYLRSLGLHHVYDSRNTNYENDIREALGGNRVTVVLNSLTGPGFKEATLSLCAQGARFIEISKMNIWSNEQVRQLRPDILYEVTDVSLMPKLFRAQMVHGLSQILRNEGIIKLAPVPSIRFDLADIRDALEYIEKAKHVGKVVITMPEISSGDPKFNMFTRESTYLVTGGMRGIGLEVAQWMTTLGATNLLLLGRNAPSSTTMDRLATIQNAGVKIVTKECDVSNFEELQQIFAQAEIEMPPIRGIMHVAGVIEDAMFENQTWEKYVTAYKSKVHGTWNLHKLSTTLEYPLEHFFVFSSVSTTFGSVGQSNYAAANSYVDSFIQYRHSIGLPATSINWGQWNGVGMAANLVHPVIKPFSVNQGLNAIGHALRSQKTQIVCCDGDLGKLKTMLNSTKGLLSEIELASSLGNNEIDGSEFWNDYDAVEEMEQKYSVVRTFIRRLVRMTLKMDKNEEVHDYMNFQDLGMDSLMMVELKNGLQASVGRRIKISINAVKDCKTVAQLSTRLVELISGKKELPAISRDELMKLVSADCILPGNIQVTDSAKAALKPVSQINTVLLTGATGNLGPYVLRELLKQPGIEKVYCLMRKTPLASTLSRFNQIYKGKQLLDQIDMSKVELIEGDTTGQNFDIEQSKYNQLAAEVDAVINIAAKVAFDERYGDTMERTSSRVINVLAMRNILEFAVKSKLKHICHSSAMAAESQLHADGTFWEDWPLEEELATYPNSAYPISKLICDRLLQRAVERGVPCKVFRMPYLGGDSETGGNAPMQSFIMVRLFIYMHLGIMPGYNLPTSVLPVDQCAKFAVDLFFKEETGSGIYNVFNPHFADEREFEQIAKEFGVSLDILEPDEFYKKLLELDDKNPIFEITKPILAYDEDRKRLEARVAPFYTTAIPKGNKQIFWSNKLERLLPELYPNSIQPSWDILRRDLQSAKDQGVFDRYGIKYMNTSEL